MQVLGIFTVSRGSNGKSFGPYPYRADLLHDFVQMRVLPPASGRLHRKIRDVFEHRLGMPLDVPLRSLWYARKSDIVFAFLEPFAVLPSILKSVGISTYAKRPLVVLSCWWAEEIATGDKSQIKRIQSRLESIDAVICFSENQRQVFHQVGYPANQVFPVRFGVDSDFYSPDPSVGKEVDVVAAGIDRGRDYDTLMSAARLLPHRTFSVFTQSGRIANPPPNVSVHDPVSMDDHRNNLRRARLVVIPTHELQYPTGQSVLLEAMACGTATAVTSTAAMSEYIRDSEWNFALPLHDGAGVATIIEKALDDDNLRNTVAQTGRRMAEDHFHFRNTWNQVFEVFKAVRRTDS